MLYICGRWCSRARRCLQGSMASAADDMQRRSRALAAGRPMGREGKTFPKIFQKMPFKSLWNHKKPHKQRDCEQCGRTMVEQSDPSHLYIYASCVCVRARRGCGTAGMQDDWPTLQAHSQVSQLAGTWAQGGRHAQDPRGR